MPHSDLVLLVLAAGRGSRMRSGRPKVMHPLACQTLLAHVLAAGTALGPSRAVLTLAPGMDEVAAEAGRAGLPVETVIQNPPLGTGHAVAAALPLLPEAGVVLVLYGDTPLLRPETLRALLDARAASDAALAVLGMRPPETKGYGRLAVDRAGGLAAIVEARHAGPVLLRDGLCNAGVMAFDAARLRPLIEALTPKEGNGEYYLTDVAADARGRGWAAVAVEGPWEDGVGVNSQDQLAAAEAIMQGRLRRRAMEAGVVMRAPDTVHLAADTELAPGCVIEPFVVFDRGVRVGAGATVLPFCHLERTVLEAGAVIGPFARLRPGASVGAGAKVGNFVEVKNATLGPGAKVNHLSYVGDADVGAHANVGAGTITCNYDGFAKHRTEIGEGAFIGSNTALVAPVRVGAGALVGAGATIAEDVPDDALAVARAPQRNLAEGGARFRAKRGKDRRPG